MSKMDRNYGGIYKKGEEPDDLLYWLSRPPIERLKALEEIRQGYNIWKYGAEPCLQRVCKITKRKWTTEKE